MIHKQRAETVTEIYVAIRTNQTIVSSQLRILKEAVLLSQNDKANTFITRWASRIDKVNALITYFVNSSPRNFLEEFEEYAKETIKNDKPIAFGNTPQDIKAGLKELNEGLNAYYKDLVQKAVSITLEAQGARHTNNKLLKTGLSKIASEAVKLFLKRYGI